MVAFHLVHNQYQPTLTSIPYGSSDLFLDYGVILVDPTMTMVSFCVEYPSGVWNILILDYGVIPVDLTMTMVSFCVEHPCGMWNILVEHPCGVWNILVEHRCGVWSGISL